MEFLAQGMVEVAKQMPDSHWSEEKKLATDHFRRKEYVAAARYVCMYICILCYIVLYTHCICSGYPCNPNNPNNPNDKTNLLS